jgi:drug/metabolite transporter (DMT)-like permease
MLGEQARPSQAVGAILIIGGVLLTRWERGMTGERAIRG